MTLPIAVVIPSYNRVHTLARAIDSVLMQTVQPQELCVVDDGSVDGTGEFISIQYPQVKYLHQHNRGVSAARNHGVRMTDAAWLAFLDSDDEWLPDKLAVQYAEIEKQSDAQLVHCEEIWIRNGKRVNPMLKHRKQGGDIFQQSLALCAISPSSVMISRHLFEEMGGFDETLPVCEDYDLWLRISSRYSVNFVDTPLVRKYGGHDDQLSRQYWGMDRFRVLALAGLLRSDALAAIQKEQALAMLREKCRVLMLGATRRDNKAVLEQCQRVLTEFEIRHDSET